MRGSVTTVAEHVHGYFLVAGRFSFGGGWLTAAVSDVSVRFCVKERFDEARECAHLPFLRCCALQRSLGKVGSLFLVSNWR